MKSYISPTPQSFTRQRLVRAKNTQQTSVYYILQYNPWNSVQPPPLFPWLVLSDSTRRAEHAHIAQTSQRLENLELAHFEVGNCEQKITLFSAIMSFFSPLGGDRSIFKDWNESYCMVKQFFRYVVPPSPYDSLYVESRKICNIM